MYPDSDMPGNDIKCIWYPSSKNYIDFFKKECLKIPNCVGFIRAQYRDIYNQIFICYKSKVGKQYFKKYNSFWKGESYFIL